jgi:beta-lactamase class C
MPLRKSISCLLVCIIFMFTHTQPAICADQGSIKLDTILTNFDSYVDNFIKQREVPGAAIAIVVDTQIVFIKGYGVKKIGEDAPIGVHSVFRIASLSKGFASVLSALLVRDSVFSWDDKVTKYLPDFSLKDTSNTNNLTIRNILSHTSGLMPHAYDNLVEANMPLESIVRRLKDVSVICPVGDCYGYQNVVYSIISEVIESATHKKYIDLLQQRLIKPLGMKDVSFSKKGFISTGNLAYPHIRRNGKWKPTSIRATYYNVQPAAGVNASVYDMALWVKGLVGGMPNVISPDIINEIYKPVIKTPRERRRFNWKNRLKSAYYGMGWRIFDYAGQTMIYHSGGLHGYRSQMAFLPRYKFGIVLLQNAHFGNHFIYKLVDMYLNIDNDLPDPTVEDEEP